MTTSVPPPPIIDAARVLEYAHVGDLPFTGRIHLNVGGEWLGQVANLAICLNRNVPDDILLLFCDDEWTTQGCIGRSSVDDVKLDAERGYPGVGMRWRDNPHDAAAVDAFLRDVYEVDPSSEWWTHRCSFCQRVPEAALVTSNDAAICQTCIRSLHATLGGNDP
jgi:hypothetical protein